MKPLKPGTRVLLVVIFLVGLSIGSFSTFRVLLDMVKPVRTVIVHEHVHQDVVNITIEPVRLVPVIVPVRQLIEPQSRVMNWLGNNSTLRLSNEGHYTLFVEGDATIRIFSLSNFTLNGHYADYDSGLYQLDYIANGNGHEVEIYGERTYVTVRTTDGFAEVTAYTHP